MSTNFAPIFSYFSNFVGHSCGDRRATSDDIQICSFFWKGLFFPEKKLQTASKSADKYRRCLLLN